MMHTLVKIFEIQPIFSLAPSVSPQSLKPPNCLLSGTEHDPSHTTTAVFSSHICHYYYISWLDNCFVVTSTSELGIGVIIIKIFDCLKGLFNRLVSFRLLKNIGYEDSLILFKTF